MIVDQKQRWWLGNAEERASPTFEIPTAKERSALGRDDLAKLIFEFAKNDQGCEAERMWVRVTGITKRPEGPLYMGSLANDPFFLDDVLKAGDQIVFEPKHIIDMDC